MNERASEGRAHGQSARQSQSLPMFFRRLEVLEADKHGDLGLLVDGDYGFARDSHMIPLNAIEFMAAARHYPILFNGDQTNMPVVLVGVRHAQNLFVEAEGHWTEGCYIPAFVRRYPFILLRDSRGLKRGETPEVRLGVDTDAPMVTRDGGHPLFEGRKPSDLMKRMGRFAGAFAREQSRTRKFVDACREQDLLIDRAVDVELADKRHMAIKGFRVIDEERLRALPSDQLETWWRSGWFALAVAHLVSLGNFGRLFMKDERQAEVPIDFTRR
ncbi:SapC family protein [Marivibrio halodurans]|uniref:SapC family protein n=1 Tax=Marivibrio halodurans TaxID=2039722 RepID=A0A8J7S2Y4_9PROT|nr:SapC family protein [Marivibrio halodurans]MBP5855729.1 SapC family protein [Marivibrio halodurans]